MNRKKSNKEKLKEWKRAQKDAFEKSLPFPRRIFEKLMDYLDLELGRNSCKDNYLFTEEYLLKCGIELEKYVDFFIEHGGGCDCEVLANMDELFEKQEVIETIEFIKPNQPKSKSKAEILKSIDLPEFKISKIPKPWKLRKKGNRYEFRLGKSYDIFIKKMKRVSDEKWGDASFWIGRWNQLNRNELEGDKDVIYSEILEYELVIAKSKKWAPTYIWIRSKKPKKWMLQFQTSSQRLKSDLEFIKTLLKEIED